MLKVKNLTSDEVQVVYRVHEKNGVFTFEGVPSEKVLAKMAGIFTYDGKTDADGNGILTINSDWAKVGRANNKANGEKKAARKPREKKADATPETTNEPTPTTDDEPTPTPAKVEPTPTDANDDAEELVRLLGKLRGGNVDENTIKEMVKRVLVDMVNADDEKAKKAVRVVRKSEKKNGEYYCKDFDDMLNDVRDGYNIYLYGAAGSGKSHTAEQIADALGLAFYGQTTIQFAHDVRGYGDAGGNFVDTPFFKAFANGGLYFQDEYDRSNTEAAIVLNSALANGWYDFPVIGRVNAHPDFRFMAAGNTLMTGADEEYVSGQIQDASCRDRFGAFYACEYNHEVELNAIAKGDAVLVAFVEDVRRAIKTTGLQHIVSYRATAYMVNRQNDKTKTLVRCTFKGLDTDAIREIYGALTDKENDWAKAMKKAF